MARRAVENFFESPTNRMGQGVGGSFLYPVNDLAPPFLTIGDSIMLTKLFYVFLAVFFFFAVFVSVFTPEKDSDGNYNGLSYWTSD